MRKVKITLDGQQYEVCELRSRDNAAWREKIAEGPLEEIVSAIKAADVELSDPQGIAQLIQSAGSVVLGSIDTMKGLLIDYAPDLKDAIDNAYDSEIADAFTQVLGLAYPFGVIVQKLRLAGLQLRAT